MNKIMVGLFEDTDYNLLSPLCYLRPVFEIRNGVFNNRERIERIFPKHEYCLFTRNILTKLLEWEFRVLMRRRDVYINRLVDGYDIFLINGRVLLNEEMVSNLKELLDIPRNVVGLLESNVVVLKLSSEIATKFRFVLEKPFHLELLSDLEGKAEVIEIEANLVNSPKNFLESLDQQLKFDFKIAGVERTVIEKDSDIHEDVVFDDTKGPIFISRNVKIRDSLIRGPIFIGEGVRIEGSDISKVVIGDECKILNSVIRDSIIMNNTIINDGCHVSKSIISSWSKIMPLACIYGDLIKHYEWRTDSEFIVIGDYATIGPGAIVYPGVNVGIFSSIHGICESEVKSFEVKLNSTRRKLSVKEVIELAQVRAREVNKFISDYELNLIRKLYEELM